MEIDAKDLLRDMLSYIPPLYWLSNEEALYRLPNDKIIKVRWDLSVSPAAMEAIYEVQNYDPVYH